MAMMMKMRAMGLGALVMGAVLACGAAAAPAQDFTYQGKLESGGVPTSGVLDARVRMLDSDLGGNLDGAPTTFTGVVVEDGLFVLGLPSAFSTYTGEDRYLEFEVRESGAGAYTLMAPRQKLTPTPYAQRSLSERWIDNGAGRLLNDSARVQRVLINRATTIASDEILGVRSTPGSPSAAGLYVEAAQTTGTSTIGLGTNGVVRSQLRYNGASGLLSLQHLGLDTIRVNSSGLVGISSVPVSGNALAVGGQLTATGNVVAADFRYSSLVTRYLTIAPEGLRPTETADAGVLGASNGAAYLNIGVNGTIGANVSLPDGASVNEFMVVLVDNTGLASVSCSLFRREFADGFFSSMAVVNSDTDAAPDGATPVTITDSTVSNGLIDNSTFVYCVRCFSSNWQGSAMTIKAIRIRYTVPGPR